MAPAVTFAKCYGSMRWALAATLAWFCFWNLTKLPYLPRMQRAATNLTYAELCPPSNATELDLVCVGPEFQASLRAWSGFRSYKLITDQALFVAPHLAGACVLEALFVWVIVKGWAAAPAAANFILPLTFVFALHVVPVEHAFPTRVANGTRVNLACVVLMWMACSFGFFGLFLMRSPKMEDHKRSKRIGERVLRVSLVVIGVVLNSAPFAEWILIASSSGAPPEGDLPHELSGKGPYASCDCPALGWMFTALILLLGVSVVAYLYLKSVGYFGSDEHDSQRRDSFSLDGIPNDDGVVGSGGRQRLGPWSSGVCVWQLWKNRNPSEIRPEVYLGAWVESFSAMLLVSWIATAAFNYEAIDRNRIKDIMGYNNVCVGFDTPPARYIAAPLMVLMAYFGVRYVLLDNWRAKLEKDAGEIIKWKYKMTRYANLSFAVTMLFWPALLIITPMGKGWELNTHFYIYVLFVVVVFCCVAANFFEADHLNLTSTAWMFGWGLDTVLLLSVGYIAFNSYDYDLCPTNNVTELPREICEQTPFIPAAFLAFLDNSWFILLALTPILLPSAPSIVVQAAIGNEAQLRHPSPEPGAAVEITAVGSHESAAQLT